MTKEVILTGLRANNDLHIGNYFGSIMPMVTTVRSRSNDFQVNMFIPDLHSFTTPINHSDLYSQSLHNAQIFVAAGLPIDSPNVHLYRQSFIPAHSELTWILNCFTGFGEMSRMTQFKDKSAKLSGDQIGVGLFDYPVLMAADILLYDAKYVPVGDDQTQHLEFTRDIAQRMNNRFGNLFTIPEPVRTQHEFFNKSEGLRIMDLADPTKKMSKSDESGRGVIFMGDDPQLAAKKIMSATTDDKAYVRYDKSAQPGISNLLEILACLRGTSVSAVTTEFEGTARYGDFKKVVATEMVNFLEDFQSKLATISNDLVLEKLEASEAEMREVAAEKLYKVQKAVGLRN